MFSCRVTVGAPLEYEPPTIEILAVCDVRETRWKRGWTDESAELASGKSLPTATEYSVPLTEMTALVGRFQPEWTEQRSLERGDGEA